MCLPSSETVADQLIQAVSDYKAKSVFVARDNAKYDGVIRRAMEKLSVSLLYHCLAPKHISS